MPTAALAKRYFEALSAHDLDAATACWAPGGVDRFVGITGGLAILLIVSLLLWPREAEFGEDKASAAD